MTTICDVTQFLERFAPTALAEEWDNVGLLVGDQTGNVTRIMTCLTVTEASAAEAIAQRAELIVTHHPLPFRPLKQITADARDGRLLWRLIRAGIAVYSPHTAFDSAVDGINARLASQLTLANINPLVLREGSPGAGRWGHLAQPISLQSLADRVKALLKISQVQIVGDASRPVQRIAVACGSGGEFLPAAAEAACDLLLTGEARFHACLEAESLGIALMLAGHYATERLGIEQLADVLAAEFGSVTVWPSRDEADPLWVA